MEFVDDDDDRHAGTTIDSARPRIKTASQECMLRGFEDRNVDTGLQAEGQPWPAKHFLRTAYHQIWPPLTYVEVKCHITAEIVGR